MDQGVLDPCKRRYKCKLLAHIVLEEESENKSVSDILKGVTMKDVVYWIASAWEEARNDSLRKAWRNLLLESEESETADGEEAEQANLPVIAPDSLGPNLQEADVFKWVEADANDPRMRLWQRKEVN